jgi:hypothetical protein
MKTYKTFVNKKKNAASKGFALALFAELLHGQSWLSYCQIRVMIRAARHPEFTETKQRSRI